MARYSLSFMFGGDISVHSLLDGVFQEFPWMKSSIVDSVLCSADLLDHYWRRPFIILLIKLFDHHQSNECVLKMSGRVRLRIISEFMDDGVLRHWLWDYFFSIFWRNRNYLKSLECEIYSLREWLMRTHVNIVLIGGIAAFMHGVLQGFLWIHWEHSFIELWWRIRCPRLSSEELHNGLNLKFLRRRIWASEY